MNFYPSSLKLIANPPSHNGGTVFLDLNIYIKNSKLEYTLYDKRKDYQFKVNKIIHWESNLHKNIFRNIIINFIKRAQILHSNSHQSHQEIIEFAREATKQHYPTHFIFRILHNTCNLPFVTTNNGTVLQLDSS